MVYITSISGSITLPRHTYDTATGYTLVLTGNMSSTVTLVDNGSNVSTNPLYYKFTISTPDLNVGEYTYKLVGDDDQVLETGLVTYGEYKREVIVNTTSKNEKIQYNG